MRPLVVLTACYLVIVALVQPVSAQRTPYEGQFITTPTGLTAIVRQDTLWPVWTIKMDAREVDSRAAGEPITNIDQIINVMRKLAEMPQGIRPLDGSFAVGRDGTINVLLGEWRYQLQPIEVDPAEVDWLPPGRGLTTVQGWGPIPDAHAIRRQAAESVDPREIAVNPAAFIGRNVLVRGRASILEFQPGIGHRIPMLVYVSGMSARSGTEDILVTFKTSQQIKGLVRGEELVAYGIVTGTAEMQIVLTGATKKVPLVEAYSIFFDAETYNAGG